MASDASPFRVHDYLTSLFAIHSVPCTFPCIPSSVVFLEPITSDPSPDLLVPPSSRPLFHTSSSLFYHMFLKKTLDQHVDRVPLPSNATIYYECRGNRLLELTSPPDSPQRNLPKKPSQSFSVSKSECLFRAHWNKKYPLGKTNIFHTANKPSDFPFEILWQLKLRCATHLQHVIESLLGIYCPIPSLESIRDLPNTVVLRELLLIPKYTSNSHDVARIVLRICRELFPPELWEPHKRFWNQRVTKYIVEMSKYDSMRFSKSRKIEIFLFRKFFIPLISYLFYATESSDDTVYYFRRPVWDLVTTKASKAYVELLQLRRAAAADAVALKLRWLPKKSGGLRPIVTLPKLVKDKSKRLLRYLTAVRCSDPKLLGTSILSRDDSFSIFKTFFASNNIESQFRFFTADIQNCFESIPFGDLEKSLVSLAPDNTVFDSVMVTSCRLGGFSFPRKRPVVFVRGNLDNLLNQIPSSSDPRIPIIVRADMSSYSNERMDYAAVRKEIIRVVRGTVYKLNIEGSTTRITPYVVSSRGLPQGNSLSVLLVSLYYAWLDRQTLGNLLSSPSTLLLRLVDDIVCISREESEFNLFFQKIINENLYGKINNSKLQQGVLGSRFSWAGFTFIPSRNHLNVSPEPTFFSGHKSRPKSISLYFSNSLGRSLAQQCLRGFFCPRLNSVATRNENAYRAGVFTGRRIRTILDYRAKKFPTKLSQYMRRRFNDDEILLKSFHQGLKDSL